MNLDDDVTESQEWLDALKAVQVHRGADRTNYLISRRVDGPGPADGELPGALPEVPGSSTSRTTPTN